MSSLRLKLGFTVLIALYKTKKRSGLNWTILHIDRSSIRIISFPDDTLIKCLNVFPITLAPYVSFSQKIRKENLTSSSRVTCRWTDQGQFVSLDYNYDHTIETALNSDVLFAELYEDGSPCKETWDDAICIARYVSRELGIPVSYK